jgi:hypothetical protein
MGPLDFAFHLFGFIAPAFAVTLLVALAARILWPGTPVGDSWWVPIALNFIAGSAVLYGGLWLWGRDGKMATYAALLVVIATGQWLCSRGWRR